MRVAVWVSWPEWGAGRRLPGLADGGRVVVMVVMVVERNDGGCGVDGGPGAYVTDNGDDCVDGVLFVYTRRESLLNK